MTTATTENIQKLVRHQHTHQMLIWTRIVLPMHPIVTDCSLYTVYIKTHGTVYWPIGTMLYRCIVGLKVYATISHQDIKYFSTEDNILETQLLKLLIIFFF